MNHIQAVRTVEKLVPELNASQNPEEVLIKYAKDNNLSPAELERLGQVVNTAKTVSHMKKSASRGSKFRVVNVKEMVDKFETFEPPAKNTKSASNVVDVGHDAYRFPVLDGGDYFVSEKKAFAVDPTPSIYNDIVNDVSSTMEKRAADEELQNTLNTLEEIVHDYFRENNKLITKLANAVIEEPTVFTDLDRDSLASPHCNQFALCKLANHLLGNYPIAPKFYPYAKRASTKLVRDTTGLLETLTKLENNLRELAVAQEMYKSAAKKTKKNKESDKEVKADRPASEEDVRDALTEPPEGVTENKAEDRIQPSSVDFSGVEPADTLPGASAVDNSLNEEENAALMEEAQRTLDAMRESGEYPEEDLYNFAVYSGLPYNAPSETSIAPEESAVDEGDESTPESSPPPATPSSDPGPLDVSFDADADEAAATPTGAPIPAPTPAGTPTPAPADNLAPFVIPVDAPKKPKEKKEPSALGKAWDTIIGKVDAAATPPIKMLGDQIRKTPTEDKGRMKRDYTRGEVGRALALQQSLLKDPIIANADPDRVVSLFNSLVSANPDFMSDPNLIAYTLREALQYDGVAPHTYQQLVEIDKNRQQADKDRETTREKRYKI